MASRNKAQRGRIEHVIRGSISALACGVAMAAFGSAAGLIELPYRLAVLDHRLPVVFRVHMAASGLGLLLLPVVHLAVPGGRVHRTSGAITAIALTIGGVSAVPSALLSEAAIMARIGFMVQALVGLGCVALGVVAICSGRIAAHRRHMANATAVFGGVILLRFLLSAVALLGLPFEASYAALAWLSWLLPLLGLGLWRRWRD